MKLFGGESFKCLITEWFLFQGGLSWSTKHVRHSYGWLNKTPYLSKNGVSANVTSTYTTPDGGSVWDGKADPFATFDTGGRTPRKWVCLKIGYQTTSHGLSSFSPWKFYILGIHHFQTKPHAVTAGSFGIADLRSQSCGFIQWIRIHSISMHFGVFL